MICHIRIQTERYDLAAEELQLRQEANDAGATVTFQGVVRANDHAIPLRALFLEHFPGVTESEIRRIAVDMQQRWPVSAVRVIHRVGELAAGEPIVMVMVASAHRKAAFAAAEFLMDYLKTEAPFWKKEILADDSSHWVDAKLSDGEALKKWGL